MAENQVHCNQKGDIVCILIGPSHNGVEISKIGWPWDTRLPRISHANLSHYLSLAFVLLTYIKLVFKDCMLSSQKTAFLLNVWHFAGETERTELKYKEKEHKQQFEASGI